ncbi:4'-phosphopantetheinyl transferase family protein [Oerskovia sp. NPDC056781]|uniref:4'-phosphopantetheinyl transferase family protein n=1 Tax=Oerskovia sp. NPDC056781 TaxID=3345942 RepID=UPI00366FD8DC
MPTSLLTASVTIWCAPPAPCLPGQVAWLSADEAVKASRFRRPVDLDRFVTGRLLTRAVLGERLHQAPEDVDIRLGAREGAAPGRPYVAQGPSFSIAHAESWVLVAVVDPAGPPLPGAAASAVPEAGVDVGVDVESTAPARAHLADLLDAVPADERPADGWDAESFTRSWVRREAVLKAVGTGLLAPRDDLLLSRADRPAHVVHSGGLLPAPDRLAVRDLELPAAWPSPSAGQDVTLGRRERHPRRSGTSPSAGKGKGKGKGRGGGGTYLAAVALRSARGPVALGSVRLADGTALLARHGITGRPVLDLP